MALKLKKLDFSQDMLLVSGYRVWLMMVRVKLSCFSWSHW